MLKHNSFIISFFHISPPFLFFSKFYNANDIWKLIELFFPHYKCLSVLSPVAVMALNWIRTLDKTSDVHPTQLTFLRSLANNYQYLPAQYTTFTFFNKYKSLNRHITMKYDYHCIYDFIYSIKYN